MTPAAIETASGSAAGPAADRPVPSRQRNLELFALCLLALAAAPLLEVLPGERVGVRGVSGLVLPPSCASRELLGVPCPGCGLTRSFVHLARGDWRASVRSHHLGWLLMTVAAFQLPYRAHLLWGSGRFVLPARTASATATALVALLILNWLLGFVIPTP